MRDHNKAFCRLVAETFDCPGPVFEFGSYQVEGQDGYADLRALFPGQDLRRLRHAARARASTGSRTSRAISLPDASAGTVLCIETFEHVFEVRRAFDEVFRILKPGGLFVITSPLNFRIHGYPDDYWRMTPNCLRRMLEPYAARLTGYQGYHAFPHSVMGLGIKAPRPADFAARADALVAGLSRLAPRRPRRACRSARSSAAAWRSSTARRASGTRSPHYYTADFTIDVDAGRWPRRAERAGIAVATRPSGPARDGGRGPMPMPKPSNDC